MTCIQPQRKVNLLSLLSWYNKVTQAAKRRKSYRERQWIRTGLCVRYEMFKVNKITIASAKSEYCYKISKQPMEMKGQF